MRNAERGNISAVVLIALLLISFMGCGKPPQALAITGDCQGYTITANTALEDAIALANPHAEEFGVFLVGSDGLIARVPGDELSGCQVIFSRENAWEIKSELHPPSARVKGLARIAVVSASREQSGQLLLHDALYLLKEEGTSRKNNRGVTVYTTRLRVPLADGQIDIAGDLPDLIITETYADAMRSLKQGERVMILNLDGLGWEMLTRADAPYLQSLQPERALACYPPISQVSLASMLTGEPPHKHGVHDRKTREMAREDIFAKAQAMGKSCAYIEGSQALLKTSVAPVLSLSDEEAFASARKALESNPDLLFVHFHEIDETAHAHGPYAERTMQKIREIDGYAKSLCEGFEGRIIITADHGLHETKEGGGDHGQFVLEDMIVPYIII